MTTPSDITEEFVLENDGKLIWLCNSYLSLRGYSKNPVTTAILEKVVEVQANLRAKGHILKSDLK